MGGLTGPSLQGPGRQNDATDYADLREIIRSLSQRIAEMERGAPLRQAGIVTRPRAITSTDYDGTDRTHLGTVGWALGSDDAGSYLALNGVNVYDDLAAKAADITAQQDYLASLVTKDATGAAFNTGTIPPDGVVRWGGAPASLSIDCPTGKLRIVVACSEASIAPGTGGGAVEALLSFSAGTVAPLGTYTARLYSAAARIGAAITRVKTLTVPPGTYTVTAQAGYWASGTTAASINFAGIDLSVEVVNGA